MQHRAIETRYKGYRFRSRLEARWAVFFDALGLRWEYEPEGFELPGGVRYLPDFKIGGTWFEVKPSGDSDISKVLAFVKSGAKVCVLAGTPDAKSYPHYQWDLGGPETACELTGTVYPAVPASLHADALIFCPWRTKYGGWYYAWGEFAAGGLPHWFDDGDMAQLQFAVIAARSARFEHGESGAR